MNKILVLILFSLYHASCYACAVPFSGDKYNSLINIKLIDTDEYVNAKAYRISFPTIVEGLKYEEPLITLYNKKDEAKESDEVITLLESYIVTPMAVKEINDTVTGFIVVSDKSDLTFTVNISWWSGSIGLCPINALQSLNNEI
ncbi:MAG: hypothetical protein GY928_09560 [Colwellia sp.]|nr:hypothetical protein [Colwellia sp.]